MPDFLSGTGAQHIVQARETAMSEAGATTTRRITYIFPGGYYSVDGIHRARQAEMWL